MNLFAQKARIVNKEWGREIWFAQTDDYMAKVLEIKAGRCTSGGLMHYHKFKEETLYLESGRLAVETIEDGDSINYTMHPGQHHHIMPGVSTDFESLAMSMLGYSKHQLFILKIP